MLKLKLKFFVLYDKNQFLNEYNHGAEQALLLE